ncbi:nucleotidyltransferase domain-containing protein [Ktedonosporobacter rubrisoli]|nr:nucleotidyltransferase domain-containing protein [Ktedonosporobacter rubrisoli]
MNPLPLPAHHNQLIDTARQLIEPLKDKGLRAAFLFGSVAWGDADPASDLDLMLLLDQPVGYREVTRIRLADFLKHPQPGGPLFADLDRISAEAFVQGVGAGSWVYRVVNSIILLDTDNFYAQLRDEISSAFLQPSARKERFLARQKLVEESRTLMLQSIDKDAMLAALYARQTLQDAGAALIELGGMRASPSHFIDSLEQALHNFKTNLFEPCLTAFALNASTEAIQKSRDAYDLCAEALKHWVEHTEIGNLLSVEDRAWAQHVYGQLTYEEIEHKVTSLREQKRLPALLYYLDGLLQIPIRIDIGNIFLLRTKGSSGRMSLPDFMLALRQEPALYKAWTEALRFPDNPKYILEISELATQLLNVGHAAVEAGTY